LTKFSIVTVSFNSASTIRDTIESVLAQDYPDIEYIVVDGASTDSTMEIVREYGGRISRSISEPDRGIYDAMNRGIELATGDVVGFINSDDFYSSRTAVSSVARAFLEPATEVVYGDLCYVSRFDVTRVVRYWRSSCFVPGAFAHGWCPPHPTFFVRRTVYQRLGGFDLSFRIAADTELMMRYLEVNRVPSTYLHQRLVDMRLGGETNRSVRNVVRQNQEIMRALRMHRLGSSWPEFLVLKAWRRIWQFVVRPAA
jgi:glycosyltransferase involved in cell wall biosynthesis